jgi:hypothetical protein
MAKLNTKVIDLSKLSQSQVAWITGQSPSWLRAHGHLFERDADGKYNARQVLTAMLQLHAKPIDLNLVGL